MFQVQVIMQLYINSIYPLVLNYAKSHHIVIRRPMFPRDHMSIAKVNSIYINSIYPSIITRSRPESIVGGHEEPVLF